MVCFTLIPSEQNKPPAHLRCGVHQTSGSSLGRKQVQILNLTETRRYKEVRCRSGMGGETRGPENQFSLSWLMPHYTIIFYLHLAFVRLNLVSGPLFDPGVVLLSDPRLCSRVLQRSWYLPRTVVSRIQLCLRWYSQSYMHSLRTQHIIKPLILPHIVYSWNRTNCKKKNMLTRLFFGAYFVHKTRLRPLFWHELHH